MFHIVVGVRKITHHLSATKVTVYATLPKIPDDPILKKKFSILQKIDSFKQI
jgi:hypothetical protein